MEKLIICGLGVRVPEETTLESLQALADCRIVYSDLDDKKGRAWLAGYCKVLKAAPSAAAILKDAAKGGVGLAVWGNPQSSSRLAREVELGAQKAGLAYRVLGAISPIGSVFARSVSFLGGDYGYQGIQSYDLQTVLDDAKAATTELPLVLYAERGEPAKWAAALKRLAPGYPAGHKARLYAPQGETEAALTALKPGDRCVILIPPAKALTARKTKW
ncbi:MAG: SAM-dependent methyltransferase [Elusimicrobia bacterium]|nr:SAM-dependent methyltransferase [Elusimicrobiota bacterium]